MPVPVLLACNCKRSMERRNRQVIPILNPTEARIVGSLMEKSVTTPDQYPLTLNALTSACNQKSGRDPVLALQQGLVQRTVRSLQDQHLVRIEENFKSRAEKYVQRFCNTRFSNFQFDPADYAIICLLLLRGPQTPGELRARSGRLHAFDDNAAVVVALDGLINSDNGPLVVKLPRTAGRKDSEYMHLLGGPLDIQSTGSVVRERKSDTTASAGNSAELEQRVQSLEAELAEIKEQLAKLTMQQGAQD
jgi:uncharacterized protein YceH (UPF0502 family)